MKHNGAPDFPVVSNEEIDRLYLEYVDLCVDVGLKCPNARIFVSLPGREHLGQKSTETFIA